MKKIGFLALSVLATAAVLLAFPAEAAALLVYLNSPDAPMLALAPGAVALGWGRIREPMKPFSNVAASTIATAVIPRYTRTVLGLSLQLGGTTFTKALISRIEIFCGEKSIWGPVSGTELDQCNTYVDSEDTDDYMLSLDFISKNIKEIGGEQVSGLDLSTLPDGVVRVEVEIGAATAPTLVGHITWGQPQGGGDLGGRMKKLIKRVYPQLASGDQYPQIDVRDAFVLRQYFRYTVGTSFTATARGQAASLANTGTGTFGTITVAQGTPCGRYSLIVVEPGSNVGAFIVLDPKGRLIGGGNVATAFVGGGLTFTLADATDFVAGDGFWIDVHPMNVDGNLNYVEVKRNEVTVFARSCRAARMEQKRYGRTPQHRVFVADFIADNHIDSVLDTRLPDLKSLDYKVNLTAADTLSVIHEVLARPIS